MSRNYLRLLSLLLLLLLLSACSSSRVTHSSPAFSIATNQKMLPIMPFTATLVPPQLSEAIFNDFVDGMNENQAQAGVSWFGIVKDDIAALEKVLPPSHIFINGEIWSYIENAGCCSTELRIKSRVRVYRLLSRELLWEAEFPLERFFEHDNSTLAVERTKLGKSLTDAMVKETVKALQGAKRIVVE